MSEPAFFPAIFPASLEVRLLVCSARTHPSAGATASIRALVSEQKLDWQEFIDLAGRHAVLALCISQIQRAGVNVPPDVTQTFARFSRENLANVFSLTRQLSLISSSLETAGIPTMPYKGPALAALAYGNVALRQFGDLDILVRREDFARAQEQLAAMDFLPLSAQAAEKAKRGIAKSVGLQHPNGTLVELHWAFLPPHVHFPIDYDGIWKNSARIPLAGHEYRCPPREMLVLLVAIHGAKHAWSRFLWLCDVAELIRSSPDLDWQVLLELARTTRSQRMLLCALTLCEGLLETPLPPLARAAIEADKAVPALARQVVSWLFQSGGQSPAMLDVVPFSFHIREAPQDRFRSFLHFAKGRLQNGQDDDTPPNIWAVLGRSFGLLFRHGPQPFWRLFSSLFTR